MAAGVKTPTVASLVRAHREDIDAAAEALAPARRSRIHVFIATSPIHMERKLGLEPDEVLERVAWSVEYAADRADEVEFSAEDATRSDRGFLAEVCATAVRAGATVVNLPDTVGYTSPVEYAGLFEEMLERVPQLEKVQLSVHCHNDLGLAVANSLAGIEGGATQIECTVNGLGERAGNASLEEVVMALRVRGDVYEARTSVEPAEIRNASALVAELTGYPVGPNKPIVGANAFAHEAGIHQDGMLKDARTYQIMEPGSVGVRMTLPLGKHSGRHAFARACAERGVRLTGDELNAAFRRFKELADAGRVVALEDVFKGVVTA